MQDVENRLEALLARWEQGGSAPAPATDPAPQVSDEKNEELQKVRIELNEAQTRIKGLEDIASTHARRHTQEISAKTQAIKTLESELEAKKAELDAALEVRQCDATCLLHMLTDLLLDVQRRACTDR